MSIQKDIISQYANADWNKQYLGSDGLVHNRKLVSIFGHTIDLGKLGTKLDIFKIFNRVDHASAGFAKASTNIKGAIGQNVVALESSDKMVVTYLRAIEKLNRLRGYVNFQARFERIGAQLIDDTVLQALRNRKPDFAPEPKPATPPVTPPPAQPEVLDALKRLQDRLNNPILALTLKPESPAIADHVEIGNTVEPPTAQEVEEAPAQRPVALSRRRIHPIGGRCEAKEVAKAPQKLTTYQRRKAAKEQKEEAIRQAAYKDYLRQKEQVVSYDSYKLEVMDVDPKDMR